VRTQDIERLSKAAADVREQLREDDGYLREFTRDLVDIVDQVIVHELGEARD
jgi:hypothetical protein